MLGRLGVNGKKKSLRKGTSSSIFPGITCPLFEPFNLECELQDARSCILLTSL